MCLSTVVKCIPSEPGGLSTFLWLWVLTKQVQSVPSATGYQEGRQMFFVPQIPEWQWLFLQCGLPP